MLVIEEGGVEVGIGKGRWRPREWRRGGEAGKRKGILETFIFCHGCGSVEGGIDGG